MAAVEITVTGVLFDKLARTSRPVVLVGEATLTGLSVGGGPMPPGEGGGGEGPPGIWGPTDPRPTPPIHLPGGGGGSPPGIWGPNDPRPTPPIYIPPNVPPDMKPPEPPAPGSPTTIVPGEHPVAPITPPPYLIVQYPGIGPVTVAPPAKPAEPTPQAQPGTRRP